jgi:hypothetical protein
MEIRSEYNVIHLRAFFSDLFTYQERQVASRRTGEKWHNTGTAKVRHIVFSC